MVDIKRKKKILKKKVVRKKKQNCGEALVVAAGTVLTTSVSKLYNQLALDDAPKVKKSERISYQQVRLRRTVIFHKYTCYTNEVFLYLHNQ